MFVKPSRAFVGKPSVVASSSGRAKKARYARLFPSTRKRSASRAGASSSWSSAPVSVFGTTSLYAAKGPPPRVAEEPLLLAEIRLSNLLVLAERLRVVCERDVPGLHHEAAVGDVEG